MRFFFILFLCCIFCLYRILRGPTPADRVVSIDILGILIVGFCAVLGIPTGRPWSSLSSDGVGFSTTTSTSISLSVLFVTLYGKLFSFLML
ncbi:MAG: monovalent cation/H+ antiporter complex subunit F [bacterium]